MRSFAAHAKGWLALAATLFATAMAAATLAAAPAASATVPKIQQCGPPQGGTFANSTEINVQDYVICPPFTFNANVSIWQFAHNNTWVEVASGTGSVTYYCKGTLSTVYQTRTVHFGTTQFYDNCG